MSTKQSRMLALDTFRGMTITAMVLVNNPGSWSFVYAPLKHAEWHGWTMTDLIFPFFIFIVGISISLSMQSQLARNLPKTKIIIASLIRSLKLFGLGLLIALFYYNFFSDNFNWIEQHLYSLRIMGVLQRIGIVYFICVLAYLFLHKGLLIASIPILLMSYTGLMLWFPYDMGENTTYIGVLDKGNNLAAWLDTLVLSPSHVYDNSTLPYVHEPEGILTTMPAIASGLFGILIGDLLVRGRETNTHKYIQCSTFLLGGIVLIATGIATDSYFPINKALWSPSFVLLSTGFGIIFLTSCIILIEIFHYTRWTFPFVVFGANAIGFYVFSALFARLLIMIPVADSSIQGWLFRSIYQPLFGNMNGSLAWAFSFLLVCYCIFYMLYKKQLFWKV